MLPRKTPLEDVCEKLNLASDSPLKNEATGTHVLGLRLGCARKAISVLPRVSRRDVPISKSWANKKNKQIPDCGKSSDFATCYYVTRAVSSARDLFVHANARTWIHSGVFSRDCCLLSIVNDEDENCALFAKDRCVRNLARQI